MLSLQILLWGASIYFGLLFITGYGTRFWKLNEFLTECMVNTLWVGLVLAVWCLLGIGGGEQ
jgi:hypothetical protein